MDKILYNEEQRIPRKILTIFMAAFGCFLISVLIMIPVLSLSIDDFLPLIIGLSIITLIFFFIRLWAGNIKLITNVFDDRVSVAYRAKIGSPSMFAPSMFVSDIRFTAHLTREDDIEYPLEWITECKIHSYKAVNDFRGWGERYGSKKRNTKDFRTFTVSGDQAILITLVSGNKILIGTQQPQEFFNALSGALEAGKR